MKTVKILLLLLISSLIFISCDNSNAIDTDINSQESIALRTMLNEMKLTNNIAGKSVARDSTSNSSCFEIVFPVTFTYNNNTEITIANLTELIDVLTNETSTLYIEGIVFPFQVIENNSQNSTITTTINNETEFMNLVQNCGYSTLNDHLLMPLCFDFIFPISLKVIGIY